MKSSAIIATCALFFGGLSIAVGASNTIPTIPHRQASQETLASPRLAALQKELGAGNRAGLEVFWQEVTKQGTPLAEPIEGESRNVWLTFLWRAKEETRNVVIWSDLGNWQNLATLQMARLADTDLWYKTYRVRDDARFAYRLSVNDSLLPFGSEARAKQPTRLQPDPLNPRQYDLLKPYHLLILFDGSGYVSMIPAPIVLDNLLAKGLIPPTVAVLVDSGDARERELTCNPQFAEFITKELLTWVRQKYHATSDPSQTVVGGASFGGLAASYVAMKHPEIFGNVLAQSGSFWWKPENEDEYEWLTRQFVSGAKLPIRFYLQIGLLENLGVVRPDSPTNLIASRHLRDVLKAKGYEVGFQEINGGHDFFNWQAALPDGLTALLNSRKEN